MDILTKVQERQVSAKKYLEEYDIENIISEMLNSLLHDKDPHPYVYMIKYLASLMTEDERKEFGLEIPEPYPTAYPVVKYPHFKEECNNLLKKYLSKSSFLKYKQIKTKYGNNINSITKLTDLFPEDKIGCIISDSDCINSYKDLLEPIIDEVHNIKSRELKEFYINNYSKILNSDCGINQLKGYMNKLIFSFSRNVQEYPFNNFSAGNNKISEIGELLQNYIQEKIDQNVLPEMIKYDYKQNTNEIEKILKDINFDFKWMTSANLKQSWPNYRYVYISEDHSLIILINFADHLQVLKVFEGNVEINIEKGYNELTEIIHQLSLVIPFEVHKNYGYLTTNINLIGHGFGIYSEIILKNIDKVPIEGATVDQLLYGLKFDNIEIINEGSNINLITRDFCKLDYRINLFVILYLNKIAGLAKLFNNNKDQKRISFQKMIFPERRESVFKNIKKAYEETFDKIKFNISSSGTNINDVIKPVCDGNIPENLGLLFKDTSEYLAFFPFVWKYIYLSQDFDCNVMEHIHVKDESPNIVSIEGKDLDKIKSLYIFLFRNIDGYPFSSSNNNENEKTEEIIKNALELYNSKRKKCEYLSLVDNKEEAEKIAFENKLIFHDDSLCKSNLDSDYPQNRGIVKFIDKKHIFCCVNDISHFKFCLCLKEPKEKLNQFLVRLIKINNEFFKYLKFNYNVRIGFLTASPIYLGTGMRIELEMKLNKLTLIDVQKILENTEFVAQDKNNVILIINKITIGKSETELMGKMLMLIKTICEMDS